MLYPASNVAVSDAAILFAARGARAARAEFDGNVARDDALRAGDIFDALRAGVDFVFVLRVFAAAAARAATDELPVDTRGTDAVRDTMFDVVRADVGFDSADFADVCVVVREIMFWVVDPDVFLLIADASRTAASAQPMPMHHAMTKSKIFLILIYMYI